eukprot:CAMPEP_0170561986 /NCGR_PEP_ID=MMETSP0211-20121228/58111_1 /TAXON_ID=311385 /ORGANISM="Pseudokeronopsis sp., Strain OXSARD2" /LENGTH=102 /DNA_ID=CAMNT_0010878261 /DNA_START=176 /DNA_END=481 /DNA_ORIENTATION=+
MESKQMIKELGGVLEGFDKKFFINAGIEEIKGVQNEEISLFQQISMQYMQAMPKYEITEYSSQDPKNRYFCKLSVNNQLITQCLESNKKSAKYVAAKQALAK